MPCATMGMPARECDIGIRIGMRRSRSEPLLRCSFRVPSLASPPRLKASQSVGSLPGLTLPIRSLLKDPEEFGSETILVDANQECANEMGDEFSQNEKISKNRVNWVQMICEIRDRWKDRREKKGVTGDYDYECCVSYESDGEDEEEKGEWSKEEFERLLDRATWTETKLFGQLAFLCNMAYLIPEIKADELRGYYGFRLVTSSFDKKQKTEIKAKLDTNDSTCGPLESGRPNRVPASPNRPVRSSSVAYKIAASAASYIHNRARNLIHLAASSEPLDNSYDINQLKAAYKSKVATYVAASSVTAVVAAEEKARLEAASELRSLHSCPCEWFVCDEPSTCTRCFVIQGSYSLASWQANLFFEPTQFEGMADALVHRGIYEAAKGIYLQFMPEIEAHVLAHGERARFRFTGHSLGGSLSLLISLMLVSRGVLPVRALLPVVTFGSPAVFCGGQRALRALGLDEASHVLSVVMHRDIVPRAFSCDYPAHVTRLLNRLNPCFQSHPCIRAERRLYSPLGTHFILQPDQKTSPHHPLLPPGPALYALHPAKGAIRAFLNAPHPLKTLSSLAAYGSGGTILRDHESCSYLFALDALLRQPTACFVRRSTMNRFCPPIDDRWPRRHALHTSIQLQVPC